MISKAELVGTWTMVSWTQTRGEVATHPMGAPPVGALVYTDDGFLSVHVMQPDRAPMTSGDFVTGSEREKAAAFGSYLGYFGRYEIAQGRLIHRLLICSYPNWTGAEQIRFASWDGRLLAFDAPARDVGGVSVSARIVWRRFG